MIPAPYQEQIVKWGMIYQSRAVSLSRGRDLVAAFGMLLQVHIPA